MTILTGPINSGPIISGPGISGPVLSGLSVSAPPPSIPQHDAVALTGGGALAHIDLNGQLYALRITRAGKLILTK